MLYRNKYLESRLFILFILIIGVIVLYSISGMLSHWEVAYAHSLPVSETPAPDSLIKKGEPLPSRIIIDFSERPQPLVSTITVLNGKNERVDNGNFVIVGDHSREAMTTLNTRKLTDGVYTVSWMTQSSDDGHISRGSYVFGIGNVGPNAATSSIGGGNQQHVQVQTVTSNWDGLIKWPLIVSQATVVGAIFSHLFLWDKFVSRIRTKMNGHEGLSTTLSRKMDLPLLKRFSMLLLVASAAIIGSSTGLLFLQITELSPTNISGYSGIFVSLLHGPSGFAWIVRSITSIVVILTAITNYYLIKKNRTRKRDGNDQTTSQRQLEYDRTRKRIILFPSSSLLLYISLIAGSISIFANSATSHNSAVTFIPSLAVSLDWLHFMAVSMWVGGLFYISTILLAAIRHRAKLTVEESAIQESSNLSNKPLPHNVKKNHIIHYYLALLFPRFSLLATVSLGVIGISGLYMAWIHLTTPDALFSTTYGNILIIKLTAALPLILLGGYHQLKLHNAVVSIANLGKTEHLDGISNGTSRNLQVTQDFNDNGNTPNTDDIEEFPKRQIQQKKSEKWKANKTNIATKFGKTIMIESVLAICVLLIASLLTITSPNPMNMSSMSMGSSSSSSPSHDSTDQMAGMSMNNAKNNSYVKEVKILNVNTKIEINPFHSGFNTFKMTFTDAYGKPYSNLSTVRMIFKNAQADIGPITTSLKQVSAGVYTITGGYISQPGEWNIAIAAQRPSDYDLNYRFTSNVNDTSTGIISGASSSTGGNSNTNMEMGSMSSNNGIQEPMPVFDSFAVITIVLATIVGGGSFYFYKRSKQELKKTLELLES
jgi:copper transport protein